MATVSRADWKTASEILGQNGQEEPLIVGMSTSYPQAINKQLVYWLNPCFKYLAFPAGINGLTGIYQLSTFLKQFIPNFPVQAVTWSVGTINWFSNYGVLKQAAKLDLEKLSNNVVIQTCGIITALLSAVGNGLTTGVGVASSIPSLLPFLNYEVFKIVVAAVIGIFNGLLNGGLAINVVNIMYTGFVDLISELKQEFRDSPINWGFTILTALAVAYIAATNLVGYSSGAVSILESWGLSGWLAEVTGALTMSADWGFQFNAIFAFKKVPGGFWHIKPPISKDKITNNPFSTIITLIITVTLCLSGLGFTVQGAYFFTGQLFSALTAATLPGFIPLAWSSLKGSHEHVSEPLYNLGVKCGGAINEALKYMLIEVLQASDEVIRQPPGRIQHV